ncbi:hypothetical protein AB0J83_07130 [Actinoplanes sp. NPDC049596]|uniref:hypothetical protein n=1 Tax=unclassified Actinoplanes TaxID=2626549 RepID=UPI00342E5296
MTVHDHSTRSPAEPPRAWPPVANSPDDHTAFAGPTATYPTTPATDAEGTWTPPENNGNGGGRKNAKLAVAGALVAVAVASAGITAGVMAATGGDSSSSAQGGPGGGQFPGRGAMSGGGGAGPSAALHGEYVVSDGNGGYTTQLTQTGTVSAVSSSSITVKSTDGYSQTYVISSSTTVDNGADQISSVATGHTVQVIATSADAKATATSITDTDLAATGTQQGGAGQAPGGAPGVGQMPGQAPN